MFKSGDDQQQMIFFHDDIDGIYTTAMFIYVCTPRDVHRLYPLKTSMRGDKFDSMFRCFSGNYRKIIVDYQYHSDCDVWIDHHQNKSFLGMDAKDIIEAYNNKVILYSPGEKSAARTLYSYLDKVNHALIGDLKDPIKLHQLALVDMIDSAGYPDVNFVFTNTEPIMILRAYLENIKLSVENTYCRMVECIVHHSFDLKKVLFSLNIDDSEIMYLKKQATRILKKITISKDVGITSCSTMYEYPRYSEYFTNNGLPFSIRIIALGGGRIHCDVSSNPWVKIDREFNIGNFLSGLDYTFSGGGHKGVGGAVLRESDLNRFIDETVSYLNGGDEMEKYAVDSEDEVEKAAQGIVKEAETTGSSVSLEEARAIAAKQEKGKDDVNVQGGTL